MKNKREKDSSGPAKTRKVIIKPISKRQVKRFLKEPLSHRSAVIYFTEKDHKPFLLDAEGGGISSGGDFQLTKKWKLTKEKLDRIFVIAAEDDVEEPPEPSEDKG